jgi:hypothetical protein
VNLPLTVVQSGDWSRKPGMRSRRSSSRSFWQQNSSRRTFGSSTARGRPKKDADQADPGAGAVALYVAGNDPARCFCCGENAVFALVYKTSGMRPAVRIALTGRTANLLPSSSSSPNNSSKGSGSPSVPSLPAVLPGRQKGRTPGAIRAKEPFARRSTTLPDSRRTPGWPPSDDCLEHRPAFAVLPLLGTGSFLCGSPY